MTHDTRIALFLMAELVTAIAARQLKHQLQRFITEGPPSLDDTQPRPSSHPRICDREGVCQVIRGMWAAQHLTVNITDRSSEVIMIPQGELFQGDRVLFSEKYRQKIECPRVTQLPRSTGMYLFSCP